MASNVAGIAADAKLAVAKIDLDCAKIQAQIIETKGAADVQARFAVESEEARGKQRIAGAFKDRSLWADLKFAEALNPGLSIRVLHAGEGTLWTDLKGSALAIPAKK